MQKCLLSWVAGFVWSDPSIPPPNMHFYMQLLFVLVAARCKVAQIITMATYYITLPNYLGNECMFGTIFFGGVGSGRRRHFPKKEIPAQMRWTHLTLDRDEMCFATRAGSETRMSACCSCEEMAGCIGRGHADVNVPTRACTLNWWLHLWAWFDCWQLTNCSSLSCDCSINGNNQSSWNSKLGTRLGPATCTVFSKFLLQLQVSSMLANQRAEFKLSEFDWMTQFLTRMLKINTRPRSSPEMRGNDLERG